MRSYPFNSFSIGATHLNDFPFLVDLPLPEPKAFARSAFDLAFPQIIAFSSAIVGITLVVLMLKSLKG